MPLCLRSMKNDREYRFGDSGPKYLMKGPRSNFAVVQFQAGQDFKAHYHNVMEENFFIWRVRWTSWWTARCIISSRGT